MALSSQLQSVLKFIFRPQALVVGILVVAGAVSCRSNQKDAPTPGEEASWSGQMQNMSENVRAILPYLYDRDAFRNPKNRAQVHTALKRFAQAAHHVNAETGKKFIPDDLLIEYSLNNLRDDLNRAVHSFEMGQLEYARTAAKSSIGHCFRCHSVTSEGGVAAWDIENLNHLNLAPLEKADLLVATRKYDKAVNYMEGQLNSPDFLKKHAFDFEAMLRRYLALIIRVESAPQRALKELDRVVMREDVPHYIQEQAESWRQSLKAWASEKKPKIANSKQLFDEVEKRFRKAGGLQRYEKDHAGDVEYLRATALLHESPKMLKSPAE
ncbi:MAG: hypothetical protein AB7P49_21265, partial [Bdellovibrionales bacterium]